MSKLAFCGPSSELAHFVIISKMYKYLFDDHSLQIVIGFVLDHHWIVWRQMVADVVGCGARPSQWHPPPDFVMDYSRFQQELESITSSGSLAHLGPKMFTDCGHIAPDCTLKIFLVLSANQPLRGCCCICKMSHNCTNKLISACVQQMSNKRMSTEVLLISTYFKKDLLSPDRRSWPSCLPNCSGTNWFSPRVWDYFIKWPD